MIAHKLCKWKKKKKKRVVKRGSEVGSWRKGLVGVPNHERMNAKLGGLCTASSPTYSLCLHYIFTLINTLN